MDKSRSIKMGIIAGVILSIVFVVFYLKKPEVIFEENPTVGATYYISVTGDDRQDGKTENSALKSIKKGFEYARPGDTIKLQDGIYYENIKSIREGKKNKPIKVVGSKNAILKPSDPGSRILEINHSFITLEGFSIDGEIDAGKPPSRENYADKLIYITGIKKGAPTTQVKVLNMSLRNAGGECLRLRYLIENSEISNNTIERCGIYDFELKEDGKNGEAIYLGTAPEQLGDGKNPDSRPDKSNNNRINDNKINSKGNECVDIKEAAHDNTVENNSCTGQLDEEAGGISVRGNNNKILGNEIYDVIGAGIRLGGDGDKDGINNTAVGNIIRGGYNAAFKIMRMPQGDICNNKLEGTGQEVRGEEEIIEGISPKRVC